jgi:hypothetical protein
VSKQHSQVICQLIITDTGDGFGGEGPGGKRISVDAEGLVLGDDDTFWVSDEYGEMNQDTQRVILTMSRTVHLSIRQEG